VTSNTKYASRQFSLQDFEETLRLVREYKFPSLFINQFYPRPGTPAAQMKRLPTEVVKQRTREVSKLFQSYKPYDHKVRRDSGVCVCVLCT
jgi:threonylcarbamoyladenosine tRNA methylthiotransferase CDKAL1